MKHVFLFSFLTAALIHKCCSNQQLPKLKNLRRTHQEITCGEILDEYPLTEISDIGDQTVGQKVMISHAITNSDMIACTEMACTNENPCCNSCGSASKFDDIHLAPVSGDVIISCGGNNCDYMNNCVYDDGDQVLLYGTVGSYGWTIVVDQHCLDFTYAASVPSMQEEERGEAQDGRCQELSSEYMIPGTMWCAQMIGIGVWNGECKYISGCSENGHTFFDGMEDCISTCFPEEDAMETPNMQIELTPTMLISPPPNGTAYMPYEGIRACIQNTLQTNIYLPGCSVFTLQQGENATYSQRQCFWEGYAVQLPPGEEYCSDYELYFREAGDYTISSQYCRVLNTNDSGNPPIFEQDCSESSTTESEMLEVSCPDALDCMPIVDQSLSLACAYMRDVFVDECANTMILF